MSFDEEWDKTMNYYIEMLKNPELLPFRKDENIPSTLAIQMLDMILQDVRAMRKQIDEVFLRILKKNRLDELEELLVKNKDVLQKNEVQKYWDDLAKGEDFTDF